LRADFKKAREGIIKGLAIRIFYSGEESTGRKTPSFQDPMNWHAKTFLLTFSSCLFLSIKSSMFALKT
jgi:hypothetical protein